MFRRDQRLSVSQDSFCGAVSGALARTLTAPLDYSKVLYQVGVPCARKRQYLFGGAYRLTRYVVKTEGVMALFRGNGVSCMKMFPATMIQFGTYHGLRKFLADDRGYVTTGRTTLAAAVAGYTATVMTYPLNVAKTRLMVNREAYTGVFWCLKTVAIVEGKTKVWAGLSAALLSTVPSSVALFLTFELIDHRLGRYIKPAVLNETLMEGKQFSLGFIAAVIALVVTHPLDTCRKKMQAYSSVSPDRGGVDFKVEGLRQCWSRIYSRQWIFGLYSGFAPAFLRLVPFHAILLYSYDVCRRHCIKVNGSNPEEPIHMDSLVEEEGYDIEYILREDLQRNAPPTMSAEELHQLHQQRMRTQRKRNYLEELVEKTFIYRK